MNENNNKKITRIALISFAGSLPFFLGIFTVFVAVFFVLGLFDLDTSNNNDNSSGNLSSDVCTYILDGMSISDIKVQLLDCAGYDPVEGEELIDFETYITGVVYAENGGASYEALKAQAVAARSFALTRGKRMGGAYGLGIEKKDDQWILYIRSCTNDQVFCNPNKGCWSNVAGGQTNSNMTKEEWSNCTVHSGYDTTKNWTKQSLPEDSKVRKAVEETKGQVLIDNNGNIVNVSYSSTTQNRWNALANDGSDYFEILMDSYGNIGAEKISTPNCESDIDTTIDNPSVETLINLSQAEAWDLLIGKRTNEYSPFISQGAMSKRITTITVPYRKWDDTEGTDPIKNTVKAEAKIRINAALADLWLAFFTDVYNEATDFVIDTFSGCYVYRKVTNGERLSPHSYGVACDLNAGTWGNGYGTTSFTKSEWEALPETRRKYQVIYRGSKVVQIAHKYTLINGSDWGKPHDSMHFSYIADFDRERAIKCQGKVMC